MKHYVTYTTDVDVDVPVDELLEDLTDEELAELGLMRVGQEQRPLAAAAARAGGRPGEEITPLQDHIYAVHACRRAAS